MSAIARSPREAVWQSPAERVLQPRPAPIAFLRVT